MSRAERTIRTEVVIDAALERVWDELTDFSALASASRELVAMVALKPGGLRVGQWYLGLNRRGVVIWATRNVVVEHEPNQRLAWYTTTSGAQWEYELTAVDGGTRLTETRTVPDGLTTVGRVFASAFLGGGAYHTDQLVGDMSETLARIKERAESTVDVQS